MEVNGKVLEKLGFEDSKMGFFQEWQSLIEELKIERSLSIN